MRLALVVASQNRPCVRHHRLGLRYQSQKHHAEAQSKFLQHLSSSEAQRSCRLEAESQSFHSDHEEPFSKSAHVGRLCLSYYPLKNSSAHSFLTSDLSPERSLRDR